MFFKSLCSALPHAQALPSSSAAPTIVVAQAPPPSSAAPLPTSSAALCRRRSPRPGTFRRPSPAAVRPCLGPRVTVHRRVETACGMDGVPVSLSQFLAGGEDPEGAGVESGVGSIRRPMLPPWSFDGHRPGDMLNPDPFDVEGDL
ncbi:hypothetical protein ACP4OV_008318 [Aristida adscensionis]